MTQPTWRVVAPVKGGEDAKSRLAPPGPGRAALASALALDSVAAVLAAAPRVVEVLVVSADPGVRHDAAALGARPVRQTHPGAGLPGAVADGLAVVTGSVAVLLADVPCLLPGDLVAALDRAGDALDAGAVSVFVPDSEGTGTVLLAARERAGLRPAFGPASAAAHERAGALRLDLDLPRLRRDVDTPAALAEAVSLGVGPRTAAVLAHRHAVSAPG